MIKKVNNQESIDKNKKGRAEGRGKREKGKVLFSLWFIEKLLFIFNFLTKQFYTLYSHLSLHTYCSFRYVLRGRFGFTLAEALIITVMTGFCLLPILGTMQNAQQRTETYDHQSKMQMYSRSRLNAEIANGAFDHNGINLEDEYHYVVYFASGTGNLDEKDANFIELPKTNVPPDKLIQINDSTYLSSDDDYKNEIKRILEIPESSSLNYYLQIVHAYKTSVEIKDRPRLAEFGKTEKDDAGNDKEVSFPSPKSLLGIVVRTSLLESNGDNYNENNGFLKTGNNIGTDTETDDISVQVPPVTLFSFVNLPIATEESIWVADAYSKKIYGVDPVSRSLAITINLPTTYTFPNTNIKDNTKAHFEPWCLAITPNQKILAYQTSHYLNFVNIDAKSSNYRKTKVVEIASAPAVLGTGGMAFRPDGEELFVFYKEGNTCYVRPYKVSYELNKGVLKWNNAKTETPKVVGEDVKVDISTTTIVDMVAANDGYLYLGKNNGAKSEIIRFPMYQKEFDSNWKQEIFAIATGTIKSLDVSPDGTKLVSIVYDSAKAATSKSYLMKIYDTRDGRQLNQDTEEISLTNFSEPYKAIFTTISSTTYDLDDPYNTDLSDIGNKRNLNVFVTNEDDTKIGITLDDITPTVTAAANRITNSFSASDSAILKSVLVKDTQKITGGKVVVAPDNSSVIINDKKRPVLYFSNTDVFSNSNYEVVSELESSAVPYGSGKTDSNGRNCTDLVAGKRDILAFTHDKEVEFYNLNTFTQPDVGSYTAIHTITSLAMNPQGDMLITASPMGFMTKYSIFNLWDNNAKIFNFVSLLNNKLVFDDSTPNMAFALVSKGSIGTNLSAFLHVASDSYGYLWDSPKGDAYNRQSLKLGPDWIRRDLIAMPRGGALALYGKNDGSSMLEWIGRRTWKDDPDYGKYRLFARWTNMVLKPDVKFPTSDNFTISPSSFSNNEGGIVMNNTSVSVKDICYNYISLKTGSWSDGNSRYITPIIMKLSGTYTVVDSAQSLELKSDQTYTDIHLNWENGGLLEDGCIIGFWNGSKTLGANKGAVAYTSASGDSGNFSLVRSSGASFFSSFNSFNSLGFSRDTSPTYTDAIQFISKSEQLSSNFPPLGARKLAISPDQGTLAILATDSTTIPVLNLYDFNKNIYGPETQLEGMLVDYREPLSNKGSVSNPLYPFPEETGDPLFQKVGSDFRLNGLYGNKIASFPSLTTKFGPYWSSFKEYPANFMVDSGNLCDDVKFNKRFIGYIRPEFEANKLQVRYSEDLRLFYNNIFVFGTTYDNVGSVISMTSPTPAVPPNIDCLAYNSGLLQIDQSIGLTSLIGFSLATFLSKDNNPSDFVKDNALKDIEGVKYISDNPDWEPLTSTQTYILKNQPTFMGSFIAKSNPGNITLSIDNARMIYSSDKAKPVLYIGGSKYLWALYKKDFVTNLVRTTNDDGIITSNITLSTDGQKLLMAKDIGTASHTIQMLNISNPDNNLFATNNSEVSRGATKDSYLGEITKLVATDTINCLATKPHTSFNSSKIGGEYKEITKPEDPAGNKITWGCSLSTNGSMTVASGGIYIYEGNKDLFCYNPISNILTNLANVLKTDSPGGSMTSYDDVLYIFGNEGSGGNPKSGQVQSYNVNTGESLKNFVPEVIPETGYNDSYQVNMAIPTGSSDNYSGTNFGYDGEKNNIGNYITGNNVGHALHAFTSCTGDYAYSNGGSDVRIILQFDCPLTVNQFRFSNKRKSVLNLHGGHTKDVEITGDNTISGSSNSLFSNSNIGVYNEEANPPFIATFSEPVAKYDKFTFKFKSGSGKAINLIQLWRTGVKCLTPKIGGGSTITYINDREFDCNNVKFKTSQLSASTFKLESIYNNNQDTNNYFTDSESSQKRWESNAAKPWITVSLLNKKEKVCAVRIANSGKSEKARISKFKIYGSDSDTLPSVSENGDSIGSEWEAIPFTSNNDEFTMPNPHSDCVVYNTFVTAELNNNKAYKHYLFMVTEKKSGSAEANKEIGMIGFELYASESTSAPIYTKPDSDYLTPLQTDDLDEVKIGRGACCSTPYGLVYTGGNDESNISKKTSLLYWPHAINKYDGSFYQHGICRSLPDMNVARSYHALVWHKGKIYAIGGRKFDSISSSTLDVNNFIEYLDYNNGMTWTNVLSTDYKFVDGAEASLMKRYNHTACSFRDEIFIFSGETNTGVGRRSALAWNPETGVVRKLNNLNHNDTPNGVKLTPCAAIPFGSKIYIYGKDISDGNKNKMFEYTP